MSVFRALLKQTTVTAIIRTSRIKPIVAMTEAVITVDWSLFEDESVTDELIVGVWEGKGEDIREAAKKSIIMCNLGFLLSL